MGNLQKRVVDDDVAEYSASDQVVSEHGPVEKYSDIRPWNVAARIPKPPFFERSNAGVWAKSPRSQKTRLVGAP